MKTKEENPEGLHARYIVSKVSGEPVDPRAEYFVLRLDEFGGDPEHIKACRNAVLMYAVHIRKTIPQLAQDLINKYKSFNSNIIATAEQFYCNYEFEDAPVNGFDSWTEDQFIEVMEAYHKYMTPNI